MFEFQREAEDGDWVALGLTRNTGDASDYASALRELWATLEETAERRHLSPTPD